MVVTDVHDARIPVQKVRRPETTGLLRLPIPGALHSHQVFGTCLSLVGHKEIAVTNKNKQISNKQTNKQKR